VPSPSADALSPDWGGLSDHLPLTVVLVRKVVESKKDPIGE
jgi:hypothetical protein